MKVGLTLRLWTAVVGVVVMLAEGRVQQREVQAALVSRTVPGGNLMATSSHPLPPQLNTQSSTRRNLYLRHYPQEEPDPNINYWTRRARRRYYSPRASSSEDTIYTERVARARHESREPQPRRVYTTYTAAGNAAFRDSLLTSRSRTSEGEGSTAPFHQVDFPASRDNRGRYPHAQGSGEARAQVISRGNLPNRPQPDRHVGDHYSATSSHSNSRETFRPSRPLESSPHSRHRSHDPHQRPKSRLDLSTVAGDFPESPRVLGDYRRVQNTSSESREEVKNDELQELDKPDLCCGSRVPLDPRFAVATGAFQRVAPAGSIKVVDVPSQHSFPPNEVRDLRAAPRNSNTLFLTWTAPGEDLDSGTASGYVIRLSENIRNLQESFFDYAPEETLLETSESLSAAGVYQMAGTPVVAEVPLGRRLERGHVYYVALKALDNDGLSSGVSNMARFTVPESLSEDSTALHHHAAAGQHVQDPSLEEPLGAGISRETVQRREDNTQLHERTYITPSSRDADTSRVGIEEYNGETREEQRFLSTPPPNSEALESDGPENQENRNRKKNRKRKKNKSKRRKNEGRRNGRRKDLERQGRGRDTSVWGSHLHDIYAEIERWNQS